MIVMLQEWKKVEVRFQ
uniref:Uncharacterized protein n=1 Tax=Rhizophora mucronata TaxID=61149 RepID=A0A2P2IMW0_RHIMU